MNILLSADELEAVCLFSSTIGTSCTAGSELFLDCFLAHLCCHPRSLSPLAESRTKCLLTVLCLVTPLLQPKRCSSLTSDLPSQTSSGHGVPSLSALPCHHAPLPKSSPKHTTSPVYLLFFQVSHKVRPEGLTTHRVVHHAECRTSHAASLALSGTMDTSSGDTSSRASRDGTFCLESTFKKNCPRF